jgi:hypothetical protein
MDLNQNKLRLFVFALFLGCFLSTNTSAFPSNTKYITFETNTLLGKCSGRVSYPELVNSDADVEITQINNAIENFAKGFMVCKPTSKSNKKNKYNTTHQIMTANDQYISVKWDTKQDSQIVRVDSLSFDIDTGNLLSIEDILSPLAKNFLFEIVKLSHNHLASEINWEQFLTKIDERRVQFYLQDGKWYIVFNPDHRIPNEIVIARLPDHLIKPKDIE